MMKRIISVLVCVLLLCSLIGCSTYEVSTEAKLLAKLAIDITDRYLDGEVAPMTASTVVQNCCDNIKKLKEYEDNDDLQSLRGRILIIGYSLTLVHMGTDDRNDVIEVRNYVAQKIGEKTR